MTLKEAIKFLSRYLNSEYYTDKCNEAHQIAISALDKQIPKKPTHFATKLKDFTCANCGNVLEDTAPYCKFCGSKIDWSEEE